MSRRKSGVLEDLVVITAKLPWWVGVVLAAIVYLILHHFASIAINAPVAAKDIGTNAATTIIKMGATIFQYVLPIFFLIGAAMSALSPSSRRYNTNDKSSNPGSLDALSKRLEPRLPENDLYELYKSPDIASRPRPDAWNLDLLKSIDWKRFEEVCAEYFRVLGFRAVTQSHGPDGGVDITIYTGEDPARVGAIVQCKRWGVMVGPKDVREFLGVMTDRKVPEGIFVTTSVFHDEAIRLAAYNHIDLIDGKDLLIKIRSLAPAQQERLLEVATKGDYLTPSCPSCGIKLVTRKRGKDKSKFWGCLNFPSCRYTLAFSEK